MAPHPRTSRDPAKALTVHSLSELIEVAESAYGQHLETHRGSTGAAGQPPHAEHVVHAAVPRQRGPVIHSPFSRQSAGPGCLVTPLAPFVWIGHFARAIPFHISANELATLR